jgi:hypothetical protein
MCRRLTRVTVPVSPDHTKPLSISEYLSNATVVAAVVAGAKTPDEVRVAAMLRPGNVRTGPADGNASRGHQCPRIIARRLNPELTEYGESAIS